jgi:chromosome segregation ATPase
MSTQLDEMRQRQDRFDVRLTTLEEKVETEASMRAAMAQRGLLQALAETQSSQNARFLGIEGQFRVMDGRLTSVETGLEEVQERLGNVENRLGNVENRLGNVEYRLGNVENRLDRLEQGLGTVQVGVQTIIAILDRQIDEAGGTAQPSSDG